MASALHHFSTVSSGSDSAEESEPGLHGSEVHHLLPILFAVSSSISGASTSSDATVSEFSLNLSAEHDNVALDHTEVTFPPGLTSPEQREAVLIKRLNALEAIVKKENREVKRAVKHIQFYLRTKDPFFDQIVYGRIILDDTMCSLTVITRKIVAVNAAGRNKLKKDLSNGSTLWRKYIQENSLFPSVGQVLTVDELAADNHYRLTTATNLLRPFINSPDDPLLPDGSSSLEMLLNDNNAMTLLTERHSSIRDAGNQHVHRLPPFPIVRKAFDPPNPPDFSPTAILGLQGLISYLENLSVISEAAKASPKTSAASHPSAAQPASTPSSKSAATSWAAVAAKPPTTSPSLVPPSSKTALRAPSPKSSSQGGSSTPKSPMQAGSSSSPWHPQGHSATTAMRGHSKVSRRL